MNFPHHRRPAELPGKSATLLARIAARQAAAGAFRSGKEAQPGTGGDWLAVRIDRFAAPWKSRAAGAFHPHIIHSPSHDDDREGRVNPSASAGGKTVLPISMADREAVATVAAGAQDGSNV